MAKIKIDLLTGELEKKSNIIVGIDLGTTNSLVAYTDEDGKSHVVKNLDNSHTLTPSVIHFGKDKVIVGDQAIEKLEQEPERTVHSVKRLMGKSYQDILNYSQLLSYHVIENEDEEKLVRIEIDGKHFTPIELSAEILKSLKNKIETQLNATIQKSVITVPAYFNDAQRQATRDAGKLAGMEVLRIINEPTAAALAYGLGMEKDEEKIVAVYDLGGGTFDISILHIQDQVFEVLSTHGNTFLGGDDMDRAIMQYWVEKHPDVFSNIENDKNQAQGLRLIAESAKKKLSSQPEFSQEYKGEMLTLHLETFEKLIDPIVQKTIESCQMAMKDAKIEPAKIDEVLLVGGSTRVPYVQASVEKYFGKKPNSELHPDEVVALGAAVQASILSGQNKDMLLLDITPLSLGIETMGGLMDTIIARNSKIPNAMAREYTTSVDGQKNLKISVYQGERELVEHNRKLGEFILSGIPPMPAGIPKIEVRFLLDANGILTVQATEKRSGTQQKIIIKSQYGISEEEMAKMLLDSIQHAEEDISMKALIDAQNEAESLLRGAQKFVQQHASWLEEGQLSTIEEMSAQLGTEIKNGTKDSIYSQMDKLNDYTKPLAEIAMNKAVKNALAGKDIDQH